MSIRRIVTVGFCTMLALALARGQALEVAVPFAFKAGLMVLPAGSYVFSSNEDGRELAIKGASTEELHVRILSRLVGPSPAEDGTLVFAKIEGSHVLAEVWINGWNGFQVAGTPRTNVPAAVHMVSSASAERSGKEIYDQTCRRCHGPEGKGNPDADKFFKKTIPRLESGYVQSKSDAELKKIITYGRKEMDPVRIGEAEMRHFLEPESMNAVIGYIRTLRQQQARQSSTDPAS